jgi:translation initiation factor 2B subunit (eIF-2B alpha/beta/delta family)/8-oxo-dGTP pyrophosphatase MutT (NUDIX family)
VQILNYKSVVTSFIQSDEKILLLQRSAKVGTNRGKWEAVSGYLEANETPFTRAKIEIQEEVNLTSNHLTLVRDGLPLRALDEESMTVWIVHPFLFTTSNSAINIDWEHTCYEWINPSDLDSYDTVPKLKETFERVQWDLQTISGSQSAAFGRILELGEDRVSGASSLGRRAVQIIAHTAESPDIESKDDLYKNMLMLFLKTRTVQRSMATLQNMAGKFLYLVDSKRTNSTSLNDFRRSALEFERKILSAFEKESENTSKNLAAIIPNDAKILTHSYSNTAKRAFENISRSGGDIKVWVTESNPGYEGKVLARDLNQIGLQVRIVPDSDVPAILEDVDVVVVGADSVLADGSIVNKIGTRKIAIETEAKSVPFYVICETSKFSAANLLGEDIEIAQIFDVTPSKLIRKIITELGPLEPDDVVDRIKIMLRELYT